MRRCVVVLLCVLAMAGCGSVGPSSTAGTATASLSCAETVRSSLSLPQRVGQLFAVGLPENVLGSAQVALIKEDHIGSVWFARKTSVGVRPLRRVSDAVQALATNRATGRVGFFVAANQEGGVVQALAGRGFSTIPSAVRQGRMSPADLRTAATRWGRQLRAAGVNLDFAPVADVVPPGTGARNQPIGALHREYGHHPGPVARHVVAFVQGMRAARIATTAKHFPGLGRVVGNTDHTADVVDRVTTPDDRYLEPFQAAVSASVPSVMVSLATYTKIDPRHLAVFSPVVIDDLLRTQLGFRGVVMSDDLGNAEAVASVPPRQRGVRFLRAGGDLVVSHSVGPTRKMYRAVLSRAARHPGFRTVVDRAALRVLRAKNAAGLLRCG